MCVLKQSDQLKLVKMKFKLTYQTNWHRVPFRSSSEAILER